MVTKNSKNGQIFTLNNERPGFAVRMLKLVFTYLTGMINFLPEIIKNKLNLVKNSENHLHVLPIQNTSSSSSTSCSSKCPENNNKTVKTGHKKQQVEFPVYIAERKISVSTCDPSSSSSQFNLNRPSSLKFNDNSSSAGDSGVSDLSSNSNVSTPEIEFRSKNHRRKGSRSRKKSQNNKIIVESDNTQQQQQILKNSNIVNIQEETVEEKVAATVQNKQTTKNLSVQRNNNNILFDLPDEHEINDNIDLEEEGEDTEVDEELERFKMYCQETNKLFDLNDSKIVIKWETI